MRGDDAVNAQLPVASAACVDLPLEAPFRQAAKRHVLVRECDDWGDARFPPLETFGFAHPCVLMPAFRS
jgi:hypothetical protein